MDGVGWGGYLGVKFVLVESRCLISVFEEIRDAVETSTLHKELNSLS